MSVRGGKEGSSGRTRLVSCFNVLSALLLATPLFVQATQAKPHCDSTAWRSSFTNLATRLLHSELDLVYGDIQIYPTNQYTPAVHRLLQVSANIHEAAKPGASTESNVFPSVFKPVFLKRDDSIFISGYEQIEGEARTRLTPPFDLSDPAHRAALNASDNVYGIPWIIAARKGLPNFNEVSVETTFEITRRLELRKPAIRARPDQTNQLYLFSINSDVGAEAWNSYRTDFDRPVIVYATNQLDVTLYATNQPSETGSATAWQMAPVGTATTVSNWSGTGWGAIPAGAPRSNSFLPILRTNLNLISNAIFRADGKLETQLIPSFDPAGANTFPLPDIAIGFTNRVQFAIVDEDTGRVLDYVHLRTGGRTNLSRVITESRDRDIRRLWDTNRLWGQGISYPTAGVLYQIAVSAGTASVHSDWRNYGFGNSAGNTRDIEQRKFREFLTGRDTNLVVQAPFKASRRISHYLSWQANDPLVHSTAAELSNLDDWDAVRELPLTVRLPTLGNIGQLNQRFEPWGGNPRSSAQTGSAGRRAYDLRFKDPLVRSSDDWSFPKGTPLTPSALGGIHRATPWQTLYAKASELSFSRPSHLRDWTHWTGMAPSPDIVLTYPQQDWPILAELMRQLWPEKPSKLLSVNEPKQHKWLKSLDGISVLTNTLPDDSWANYDPTVVPLFETQRITFKSEQAERIVAGIESARSRAPSGYFEEAGDILQVEELSVDSPFLNLSATQKRSAITDEAYEAIALQLLPKLRSDSVGKWVARDGKRLLRFSGLDGCRYRIESSTDLAHWRPIKSDKAAHGCIELELMPDREAACVFYRSVLIDEDRNACLHRNPHRNGFTEHSGSEHTQKHRQPH